jgi:hypothetical protein
MDMQLSELPLGSWAGLPEARDRRAPRSSGTIASVASTAGGLTSGMATQDYSGFADARQADRR